MVRKEKDLMLLSNASFSSNVLELLLFVNVFVGSRFIRAGLLNIGSRFEI